MANAIHGVQPAASEQVTFPSPRGGDAERLTEEGLTIEYSSPCSSNPYPTPLPPSNVTTNVRRLENTLVRG